jgi:hypothetical protein
MTTSFALRISIQTRTSPFALGAATKGKTQGVGLWTDSIISIIAYNLRYVEMYQSRWLGNWRDIGVHVHF